MPIEKIHNMGTMTKAGKIGMIRSALRKLTMQWKPITETKKLARVERGKYKCNSCKGIVPSTIITTLKNGKTKRVNNLIVDHIIPIVDPMIGFNGWDEWINRAFDEDINNFQLLCRECNNTKTYSLENKKRLFLNEADLESEIWKDIINHEGKYIISNMGRVKSINYNNTGKLKLLKLDNTQSYSQIKLDGNRQYLIHRLVAIHFIEEVKGKDIVNHIDLNTKNNIATNLEWVNRSENASHAVGEIYKKKIGQYNDEGILLKKFNTAIEAVRYITGKQNISGTHISRVCKGKALTAYGFIWKYL